MLKRRRSELTQTKAGSTTDDHHEKNPYKHRRPNFAQLAEQFPKVLGQFVEVNPISGKGTIDFTNEDAGRSLTQALLLSDFHADVVIPKDHLCPPLPNRINYLCWLSDLIESSAEDTGANVVPIPLILDIGVGPLAIYPILGHSLFHWDFLGTEIDAMAVAQCQQNLDRNPNHRQHIAISHVTSSATLQQRIAAEYPPSVAQSTGGEASTKAINLATFGSPESGLLGPIQTAIHTTEPSQAQALNSSTSVVSSQRQYAFTATMCNPPFYDLDETIQAAEHTVCTGSSSEMRTVGGEVAFVCAMVVDSLRLRDRILWYTSMVGKHSSLKTLIKVLLLEGIPRSSIFSTTLRQGLTHRWCLAWTFVPSAAKGYQEFLDRKARQAAIDTIRHSDGVVDWGGSDDAAIMDGSKGSGGVTEKFQYDCAVTILSLEVTRLPSEQSALTMPCYSSLGAVSRGEKEGAAMQMLERVAAAVQCTHRAAATPTACSSSEVQSSAERKNESLVCVPVRLICREHEASIAYDVHTALPSAEQEPLPRKSSDRVYSLECSIAVTGERVTARMMYTAPPCDPTYNREYFNKDNEILVSNIVRQNRRWRRLLASGGSGKIAAESGAPEGTDVL